MQDDSTLEFLGDVSCRLFGKAMVQPERKEGPPEPPEVAAPAPAAPAARKAKRHVSIRLPDGESFTLGAQGRHHWPFP